MSICKSYTAKKKVRQRASLNTQEFRERYLCPLFEAKGVKLKSLDVSNPSDALMEAAAQDIRSYVFDFQMGAVLKTGPR